MTPGFTPEQRTALSLYIRAVADTMGLRDWLLILSFDPPAVPGSFASVAPVYGRKVATMFLCREFAELPEEITRHTICHELTHCITDHITTTLENTGPTLLGQDAWLVLWEATKERSESATDQIADVLAPHLPLIDWTATGDTERVVWSDLPAQPHEPDAA